jgi:SAM-dependent methyltransferase
MSETQPNAFSEYRMPTWEEDVARNQNSNEPFENKISPAQMPRQAFDVPSHLTPELMAGRPLEYFQMKDDLPIPPALDREGYNVKHDAAFFLNGLAEYLKVCQISEKYDVAMNSFFDFGCASGRVLRHFCTQSDVSQVLGSDINGRHIKWLNQYLPKRMRAFHNSAIPNLPLADNSVDVISAFSVFTHIDTFETAWLAELHRILRPGGLVYLSVQNDASWDYIRNADDDYFMRTHMRKLVPNFDQAIRRDLPDHRLDFRHTNLGPYRAIVFHSDRYLHRTWSRYFEIKEIIPQHSGYHQSVLVGIKNL